MRKSNTLITLGVIAISLLILIILLMIHLDKETENEETIGEEGKEVEIITNKETEVEIDGEEKQEESTIVKEAYDAYNEVAEKVYRNEDLEQTEKEIWYWIDELEDKGEEAEDLQEEFIALLNLLKEEGREEERQTEETANEEIVIEESEGIEEEYDDTQWPLDTILFSSPFGPRLQASQEYRYDFHRGIDLKADEGTLVYAIADGEIYRTYYEGDAENPYPEGGTVVILRHETETPINFHGNEYTTYYSLYMHLNTITVENVTSSPYPTIAKGTEIGTVGQTGTTAFNHLHFEIRVGTTCSREYQRENPTTSCATFFDEPTDPHVNPLLFLDYDNENRLEIEIIDESPITVTITSGREELDINRVEITLNGETKTVDFNARQGIDPEDIDNNEYDRIVISPSQFNSETKQYEITIKFSGFNDYDTIEATDIWGNGARIEKLN